MHKINKSNILSNVRKPLTISFNITSKCNYKCRHCYNNSGDDVYDELTDKQLLDIAEQICTMKVPSVCLCGGEPLIRGNVVFELIKKLSYSCGVVNIVSNGFLINNEVIKYLKRSGIKSIQISLDGNTEFLHNNMRMNVVAFKKAVEAISIIAKNNIDALVSFCPNKINYKSIIETTDLVYKLGAKEIRLMPLILMGRGSNMEKLALNADEYIWLQQVIELLKNKFQYTNFHISWGDPLDHLYRMQKNSDNQINTLNIDIRSDGKLLLSTYFPIILGDLLKHNLKEYWENGYDCIWGNRKIRNLINDFYSTDQIDKFNPRPYTGKDMNFDLIENREIINGI